MITTIDENGQHAKGPAFEWWMISNIPPGQASGWVIGAAATASFLGSLIGGWLADVTGNFNAINGTRSSNKV